MDSTIASLKGVRNKLIANSALIALVGNKIYNKAPQETIYPFVKVSINTELSPVINNSSQVFIHILRCQAWSQISLEEAINIRSAIFNALHRQSLTLDSPFKLIDCQVNTLFDAFLENDGKTYQSVIEFKISVNS
jgi:hypothetical protein